MLDENLPTFHFKPSSDNRLNTVLYFTHNGSDPAPEYILRRADSSNSAARGKYAVALTDTFSSSIVYAEVIVSPQWSQSTLSAAEIRAHNSASPPQIPNIPDTITVQLYNPDQQVKLTMVAGGWNKSDSWEFEMPEQSFKVPSTSRIDTEEQSSPVAELAPKVVFKWKRDGKLSKDMSCYMVGRNVGGRKSKEPDITIAMFKQLKNETAVTIYEPNMRRVEVEDQKGLEVVLLLGAEIIHELYLNPKADPFGITGGKTPTPVSDSSARKNSRPLSPSASGPAMSGAIDTSATSTPPSKAYSAPPPQPARPDPRKQAEIDAETKRLQAMVADEERKAKEEERKAKERERRDRKEAERIKKMLEQEDKDRRRKDAEIEKETERLRKKYGVQGSSGSPPVLPPRPSPQLNVPPPQSQWFGGTPPPRPLSAGPFNHPTLNSWWHGPSVPAPRPQQVQFAPPPTQPPTQSGRRRNGSSSGLLSGPYAGPAAASLSGIFGRGEAGKKVQKKRSVHF